MQLPDGNGEPVDLGYVGTVTRVDRAAIEELCQDGVVPVIPSMCLTKEGQKLNVNADTAATAVAQALEAEKLVYLSDVNGVRRDKRDPDSLIHSLTAEQAEILIGNGSIDAGMIPKVQACLETLEQRRAQDSHHRRPAAPLAVAGGLYQQGRGDADCEGIGIGNRG